jgi:hypothetical protein
MSEYHARAGPYLNPIRRAYEDFWRTLTGLTGGKAEPIIRENLDVRVQRDSAGEECVYVVSRPAFRLRGLSARRRDVHRSDYDVYIAVEQSVRAREAPVDGRTFDAVRSCVRVSYMDCEESPNEPHGATGSDPGRVHIGIHFDLSDEESGPLDFYDHPIFHAQYDLRCIDPASVGRTCVPSQDSARCDSPRIPTAPMDFSGVVFAILRDHLPDTVASGWPQDMREALIALPHLPTGRFAPFVNGTSGLSASWWYRTDGKRPPT